MKKLILLSLIIFSCCATPSKNKVIRQWKRHDPRIVYSDKTVDDNGDECYLYIYNYKNKPPDLIFSEVPLDEYKAARKAFLKSKKN